MSENKIELFVTIRQMIGASTKEGKISLGKILEYLNTEGLVFLVLIVALPISIPIPTPPGFTTIFGVPLCFLTLQMVYKRGAPWLPSWLSKKCVSIEAFTKFIDILEPKFNKATKFVKPRYAHFTIPYFERVVGILAFLCSVSIALPILFGNAIPSMGIVVMSVGLLYKDGLTVLIGMIISVIGLLIASTVVALMAFFGIEIIHKIQAFLPF